jgi:hypothetical protein
MIDKTNGRPLKVSRDGRAGPYLAVPSIQVRDLRHLLDQSGIRYWVDETAISLDGKPAVVVVNFGKSMQPDEIQSVLDKVA